MARLNLLLILATVALAAPVEDIEKRQFPSFPMPATSSAGSITLPPFTVPTSLPSGITLPAGFPTAFPTGAVIPANIALPASAFQGSSGTSLAAAADDDPINFGTLFLLLLYFLSGGTLGPL